MQGGQILCSDLHRSLPRRVLRSSWPRTVDRWVRNCGILWEITGERALRAGSSELYGRTPRAYKPSETRAMALAPDTTIQNSLDTLYTLVEPPAVHAFLQKHPFLLPFLVEAHANIRGFFPCSPVTLKVVTDPAD